MLRQSIASHVGQNIRPFYGFVRSRLNPSDDPTRGKEVRGPSRARAPWWDDIVAEDFSRFDAFLEEKGMGLKEVAGLPEQSELMADPELDGRTCKERRGERFAVFKEKKRLDRTAATSSPAEDHAVGDGTRCGGKTRSAESTAKVKKVEAAEITEAADDTEAERLLRSTEVAGPAPSRDDLTPASEGTCPGDRCYPEFAKGPDRTGSGIRA